MSIQSVWLRSLRDIADQHGILWIADEVQIGFARTGKLFAMEHHRVRLTSLRRPMAWGLASLLRRLPEEPRSWMAPNPGGLGGTYGGNPIGIAGIRRELAAGRGKPKNEGVTSIDHVPQSTAVVGL
ncbi:aminotransferase class III-fold pyridoxal phosphate-dependent enzyme [Mesorhizobium temperatum]|uniref:aminotransferase class III-fold pyridoxal phosphate-dependent enzyme n=1 Tax=Mesorhizobium temperatum TaxID=241416 RepID=UPI003CCA2D03